MAISESILPEFDNELATTRKCLARVPDDSMGWKPHEKSMSMGALVTHLANLITWARITIGEDSFDVAPVDGPKFESPKVGTVAETLATFDKNAAEARSAIAAASDDQLMQSWSLKAAGNPIFTLPKAAVLRTFVLSHMIHHRGQLSVYLRLNDISVPSIYGPSADEGQM